MNYSAYAIRRTDSDEYLIHYGISGQKWGVRRFQNPDGTLTEEGKKRYVDALSKAEKDIKPELKKIDDYVADVRKNGLDAKSLDENANRLIGMYGPKKANEILQKQADQLEEWTKGIRQDLEYNRKISQFVNSNQNIKLEDLQAEGKRIGKEYGFKKGQSKDKEKRMWEYTVYGGGAD